MVSDVRKRTVNHLSPLEYMRLVVAELGMTAAAFGTDQNSVLHTSQIKASLRRVDRALHLQSALTKNHLVRPLGVGRRAYTD